MVNNQRIAIDPDVLGQCSDDLGRVSVGLEGASGRVGGAPLGSNAFGLMNAWMVPPINAVSARSTELIALTGEATRTVGIATDAAAADFANNEIAIAGIVGELLELLEAIGDLP